MGADPGERVDAAGVPEPGRYLPTGLIAGRLSHSVHEPKFVDLVFQRDY